MKFGFDKPETIAAAGICKAIWTELQPMIGGRVKFATWKSRQMRTARELHSLGWSADQVLAKWRELCHRRDKAPTELRWVQEALVAEGASKLTVVKPVQPPGSRISAADYEDEPLPGSPLYKAKHG